MQAVIKVSNDEKGADSQWSGSVAALTGWLGCIKHLKLQEPDGY